MNWYRIALKDYDKLKDGEYYFAPPWHQNVDKKSIDDMLADFDKRQVEKWVPVESSFISHLAYDEIPKILSVRMKNGKEYSFKKVPKKTFDNFMNSESKGEFFNKIIRQRYKMI